MFSAVIGRFLMFRDTLWAIIWADCTRQALCSNQNVDHVSGKQNETQKIEWGFCRFVM